MQQARQARPRGTAAVAAVIAAHQFMNVRTSAVSVPQILAEQAIQVTPSARLVSSAFTTDPPSVQSMLDAIERNASALLDQSLSNAYLDRQFDQLVASITQDAARAAEQVSVAIRPRIFHVRFVNLPCCTRCALLAGRIYRWSEGFLRHPGCDCNMIPTTVASTLRQDPDELVRGGQVRGLSIADRRAFDDGADLGRLVNVRRRAAGLMESGHALTRGDRPTPVAIYRAVGDDREAALRLLEQHGYITS